MLINKKKCMIKIEGLKCCVVLIISWVSQGAFPLMEVKSCGVALKQSPCFVNFNIRGHKLVKGYM